MNLDDIKELRRQLGIAISMHEANMLKDMSDLEKINHLNAYGDNAWIVGGSINLL